MLWLKEAQMSLHSRMQKKEFDALSPFLDDKGVIRVGGRVDNAVVTYESRHPALLPYEHRISLLITRHMHQCGHSGVASTTAKITARYWKLKASNLSLSSLSVHFAEKWHAELKLNKWQISPRFVWHLSPHPSTIQTSRYKDSSHLPGRGIRLKRN